MLAAAALVFGASNHTDPTGSSSSSDQKQDSISTDNSVSGSSTSSTTKEAKLSPAEAQKIAQNYIKVSSASAGTPKLIKINGKYVYSVPVIDNGTTVGEININAITGKNVGGAGGAP